MKLFGFNIRKGMLALVIIMFSISLQGHPWKPSHYVIIDTDGGIDDMRAISLMLASPDIRVMGIVASGGALDPELCYIKVRSMLNELHHEGLPVAINLNISGRNLDIPASICWGKEENIIAPKKNNFRELVSYLTDNEETAISFISLGSLNTAWSIISDHPELFKRIKEVIWSSNSLEPLEGFNFDLDKKAANKLKESDITLKVCAYYENTFFSDKLITALSDSDSPYASLLLIPFRSGIEHDFFYNASDELIPLYLHFPDLFSIKEYVGGSFISADFDAPRHDEILKIVEGNTVEKHQVIKSLPLDTAFYEQDLQPFMSDIIEKHGVEEFTIGVIANEMHRHLGVYAIAGVKMGLRAREYFHIGVDEMNVYSYCGSIPPLSCTNDGLQVSTGATTGHGLLELAQEDLSCSADFTYMGRTIRLSLDNEIAAEIKKELQDINYIYGLDSNIYWELVRQKAILLWKNLDRHQVFEITILDDPLNL